MLIMLLKLTILLQDLLVGDKRQRGRPPAPKTKKSSLDQQHNVIVDEWEEVVGDDDMRKHKFRFIPAKPHADLEPLQHFSVFLTV